MYDFIPTGGDANGIQTGYCICQKCGARVETGIVNLSSHWIECEKIVITDEVPFISSDDWNKILNGYDSEVDRNFIEIQNEKLIQTLRLVYSTLQLLDIIVDGNEDASAAVDEITLAVAEVLDEIDKDKQKPDIC